MNLEQYIPVLDMCNVETISIGFDEGLLCNLYKEYVQSKLPKNYDIMQLATKVKYAAGMITESWRILNGIGINNKDDIIRIVNEQKDSGLYATYSSSEIRAMYICIYNRKPLSGCGAERCAQDLWHYVCSIKRADILLGGD